MITLKQAQDHDGQFWSMRYHTMNGVDYPADKARRLGPAVVKRGRWHIPVCFVYANTPAGAPFDLTQDKAKYWCTDTNWPVEHLLWEGLE